MGRVNSSGNIVILRKFKFQSHVCFDRKYVFKSCHNQVFTRIFVQLLMEIYFKWLLAEYISVQINILHYCFTIKFIFKFKQFKNANTVTFYEKNQLHVFVILKYDFRFLTNIYVSRKHCYYTIQCTPAAKLQK